MAEIIVTTQAEWNAIPKDYDGYIYIKSPKNQRIVIVEHKGIRVVARDNSSVEAWDNSSVEAWGNSSVVARENSSVEAWGNSSVEAWGNCQIVKYSDYTNLKVSGNARIVTLPKTPEEYCDFYGVEIRDGKAILYKAVMSNLCSFYDSSFKYTIGETKEIECDTSVEQDCSYGLHISHLHWALDFGQEHFGQMHEEFKIIECAVPIDKIIVPLNTTGKVRTSELTVLRELPPEEWGVYGRILSRK